MSKASKEASIQLTRLTVAQMTLPIIGRTPLLMNRASEKARREWLLPAKKRNRAEKESQAKHDPIGEFRSSIYRNRLDDTPTAVHMPGGAFKKAMREACLRIPGGNKTETGQLVSITNETVFVFGVPYLHAATVRQAGMTRTPDIRFRAIFPEWCCLLTVTYVPPLINDEIIANLLIGAGLIMGVGDGRPEKGALNFGQFEPTDRRDANFARIMKSGGRSAQLAAMQAAEPYDDESRDLLDWYVVEADRRRLAFTLPGSELRAL